MKGSSIPMLGLALALNACGSTAAFQPENAHDPANAEDGYLQCLSQKQGGGPIALDDGGAFFPATLPDGAVDLEYLNPEQCGAYFSEHDAGPPLRLDPRSGLP